MKPRFRRAFGGLIRFALIGLAFLAVMAALAFGSAQIPGLVGDKVGDALSALNPFRNDAVDRSGPAVLQSLTALSQLKAASGYYEVVVDLEGSNSLPDFISGDRVIYVGKGDVEALVDLRELDERRITVSEDRRSVTVNVPAPTVGEPRLDLETSYVASRDEGFIVKFRGSDLERKAQLKATEKLTAAANEGKLIDLAEQSTTATLRSVFGVLGFTNITINFDESTAGST